MIKWIIRKYILPYLIKDLNFKLNNKPLSSDFTIFIFCCWRNRLKRIIYSQNGSDDLRRLGLEGKTVAFAAEGQRFKSSQC